VCVCSTHYYKTTAPATKRGTGERERITFVCWARPRVWYRTKLCAGYVFLTGAQVKVIQVTGRWQGHKINISSGLTQVPTRTYGATFSLCESNSRGLQWHSYSGNPAGVAIGISKRRAIENCEPVHTPSTIITASRSPYHIFCFSPQPNSVYPSPFQTPYSERLSETAEQSDDEMWERDETHPHNTQTHNTTNTKHNIYTHETEMRAGMPHTQHTIYNATNTLHNYTTPKECVRV